MSINDNRNRNHRCLNSELVHGQQPKYDNKEREHHITRGS